MIRVVSLEGYMMGPTIQLIFLMSMFRGKYCRYNKVTRVLLIKDHVMYVNCNKYYTLHLKYCRYCESMSKTV